MLWTYILHLHVHVCVPWTWGNKLQCPHRATENIASHSTHTHDAFTHSREWLSCCRGSLCVCGLSGGAHCHCSGGLCYVPWEKGQTHGSECHAMLKQVPPPPYPVVILRLASVFSLLSSISFRSGGWGTTCTLVYKAKNDHLDSVPAYIQTPSGNVERTRKGPGCVPLFIPRLHCQHILHWAILMSMNIL